MSNNGTYSRKTVGIKEVHSNIDQRLIQITEDKLTLVLNEHIKFMEQKNAWIAPLSIMITLMVVFATTDFKIAYFSADTWQAIFIMTSLLSFAWFVKTALSAFKAQSVQDILEKIKQGNS